MVGEAGPRARPLRMRGRRGWAIVALLASAALVSVLVYLVFTDPGRLAVGVALLVLGVAAAIAGLSRSGMLRVVGFVAAGIAVAVAVVLLFLRGHPVEDVLLVACAVLVIAAARRALRPDVHLPAAPPPAHPVMVWNARSGGGKAGQHDLAQEARRRGIKPIELTDGVDLRDLLERLVREGADGLAAAGGDGTQAVVAEVAAEHGLPFACIPAGTRNHFALDLGVDRDDVVGALDAFVSGGERVVDLADVNGRTFVNNCSIGVYAEAVQRREYRAAKLRTLLATASAALGPSDDVDLDYTWVADDGERESGAAVILVSNNVYRLAGGFGAGTRPRLDEGVLGIGVLRAPGGEDASLARPLLSTWSRARFEVESAGDVHVGVDGEAMTLDSPLVFTIRPRALRVRISHRHPGASPSAVQPETIHGTIALLWRMARGEPIEGLR